MISITAGPPGCAPSADGERVDGGRAMRTTTVPWRPRRRFIPTIRTQHHPGWSPAASLLPPLEDRTTVCVAAQLPPSRDSVRVACRELPRLRPARLHHHPLTLFVR